ncbi:hypothetical protein CANMA_004894 [Candida margitis]|uniref:uncharacterized protein n=1 Tax=Candida margitis TaxID=1775924 RepID=UPI002225E81F|nr:uncharacterized protein CANMA_004894 [Candida margitis]KAI5954055.1 hypothetical protein CANMA_004894 [Candida margitis]
MAINLLFLAHHYRIINSDSVFNNSSSTILQESDDPYILDISINSCLAYNYRKPDCGKPSSGDGKFGDLTEYDGGWTRLDKDLCLGLSWFRREILWVKTINRDNYQKLLDRTQLADEVVIEIAASDPEADFNVKGSQELQVPAYVVQDYLKSLSQTSDELSQKASSKQNKGGGVGSIPTREELSKSGWEHSSNGLWLKYGPHDSKGAITAIDVLFGSDAVDPRPNWNFVESSIKDVCSLVGYSAFLTYRRGPRVDYKKRYNKPLVMNKNDEFKILQVADLHFSTGNGVCFNAEPPSSTIGCRADPRTLEFVNKVLDIEQPDLVVLTGDQIFGLTAPDSETAALKAYSPFIERKIPFAAVLGNHDAEGSLAAKELMQLFADLPYSVGVVGPESIDGYGNYVTTVQGKSNSSVALALYFVDSHDYSQNKQEYPGYDWIKENQLEYMKEQAKAIKGGVAEFEKEKVEQNGKTTNKKHLSMAFFHIPVPEFKNTTETLVGGHREESGSPLYNSGARDAFQEIGVKAISIGHDHCNDFCLLDKRQSSPTEENQIWLCYAGGVGLGGYGCSGYERRMRTYVFNTAKGEIKSWKRAENEPDEKIDEQILVFGGTVGNWD